MESTNTLAENPNSVCKAIWQGEVETNKIYSAATSVMMNSLKEPIFNTLRTQENLGYIVYAAKEQHIQVPHFSITVQSSTYDADHIESRINAFLVAWKDW